MVTMAIDVAPSSMHDVTKMKTKDEKGQRKREEEEKREEEKRQEEPMNT